MKFYRLLFFLCVAVSICGCSGEVPEKRDDTESTMISTEQQEVQEESSENDEDIALTLTEADILAEEHGFTACFEENEIVISESEGGAKVKTIPIEYDEYQLFLSMADNKNGYLLYCSSPAAGQMMKLLYATEDGWNTYQEFDISNRIDGYPTSLSVLSMEHLYIGTQMRSNGYLFESVNGGESWNPFWIPEAGKGIQYGYAPVFMADQSKAYVLLVREDVYSLYLSEDGQNTWEKVGDFSLNDYDSVEKFFWEDGSIYITTEQEKQYRISSISGVD